MIQVEPWFKVALSLQEEREHLHQRMERGLIEPSEFAVRIHSLWMRERGLGQEKDLLYKDEHGYAMSLDWIQAYSDLIAKLREIDEVGFIDLAIDMAGREAISSQRSQVLESLARELAIDKQMVAHVLDMIRNVSIGSRPIRILRIPGGDVVKSEEEWNSYVKSLLSTFEAFKQKLRGLRSR